MSLRKFIPTLILLFISTNAFADHLDSRQLALRKTIGANEVANLYYNSTEISQVARLLVEGAISLLEGYDDSPSQGEFIGSFTQPKWADNQDTDADFFIPWGKLFSVFNFAINGQGRIEYIMLIDRSGQLMYQQNIGQSFNGGTFVYHIPLNVNPLNLGKIRLHITARRYTTINAYGAGSGHSNPGDIHEVLNHLGYARSLLIQPNPDMFAVRRELADAEALLSRILN